MNQNYLLGLSEEGFHRVAYTEWGIAKENETPIICVHGLTRNGRDFDALASQLSEQGYHLYCPDIVGRGNSDWLKNPLHYTYEQYLADMTALIALTRAKQIDWIGTSMGGVIGMVLASLPNTPIRRLVLNDIGPLIPLKGLSRLAKYTGLDPVFNTMEEAKQYYKTIYSTFGPLTDAQWEQLVGSSIKPDGKGHFVSKLDPGVKTSQAKSQLAWKLLFNQQKTLQGLFFDIDLWEIWNKINCPVLVIRGQQSDILLPETVAKMQQSKSNVEIVEIAETGHAPVLQAIEQINIISKWLNDL